MTTDPTAIRREIQTGTVIGADRVCPVCYARPKKRGAMTCSSCTTPVKSVGRPQTYSDDALITLISEGATTPNKLLAATGLHSKTTMIKRLRRLHAEGRVWLTERSRREGFTVAVRKER